MKTAILDLAQRRTVLLDGGLGTELMNRGIPLGTAPELWNIDNPDAVRSVHRAYFEAGSDAVSTNSFGGHPLKLEAYGLRERCFELNRAAAENAVAARRPGRFVAGSLGPTGRLLKPQGEYTEKEFENGYAEQARGLAEGGADFLLIETLFDLREALCALRGALEIASDLPVLVTMTFSKTPRGFFTMMGDPLKRAADELEKWGASAIGANCTLTSGAMIELTRALRPLTGLPVIIQPNAGKPDLSADGLVSYAQSAAEFAADMVEIASAGANLVGGCCGTNPETIRTLAVRMFG